MQSTLRLHSSCMDVPWESASPEANSQSVEKPSEDCFLVCNMIVPESGTQLCEALTSQRGMEPSLALEALMTAYRNAKTSRLRTDPQYFNSHSGIQFPY